MPPNIKIAHLHTFIVVAEQGNYRRAAQILCRSQPAVSLTIKQLEQQLGANLFDKHKHAELTSFGKYFLPEARAIHQFFQTTINNALQVATAAQGRVRLGVLPSIAKHYLSHIVRNFTALYEKVELHVLDDNGDNLRANLLAGQLDITISSIWQDEPLLEAVPLCHDAVGLVGLSHHPTLILAKHHQWQQLTTAQLIRNGTTPLIADTIAHKFTEGRMQITNMASLEAMLIAGAGITTLPWLAFPKNNKKLSFHLLSEGNIQRRIAILRRKDDDLLPAADALQNIIIQSITCVSKVLPKEYLTLV